MAKTLDELFDEDDGLLSGGKVAAQPKEASPDALLRSRFKQILDFVEKTGREPNPGGNDAEHMLASRLKSIRGSSDLASKVADMDTKGLLKVVATAPQSIDELLDSDDELLSASSTDDIFELKNVRPPLKAEPDYVATRKSCLDFDTFRPLFDQCNLDLKTGRRQSVTFSKETEIAQGSFFVLGGLLVYVAEIKEVARKKDRLNGRLRLIFDNGTESDMLLRSLSRQLYNDQAGRRITDPEPEKGSLFDGREMETVYVVESRSKLPQIAALKGSLYKIGFTKGAAQDRIAKAETQPTFLMAPVTLLRTFQIPVVKGVLLEGLFHSFFAEGRLDIDVPLPDGNVHRPREWFVVPLEVIDEAVKLLEEGLITKYRYDRRSRDILKR